MSCKNLEHYLSRGKKGTIEQTIRRLASAGTNSLSHDSYAHKAAVLIQQNEFTKKMKEDTSLLYFGANLKEFMRCLERREGINDYFASLTTSRYTYENNEFNFHEEMMIENILFLMEEEKIIFLQMGVPDYMTTHTEKFIIYDAHALCIIMVPSKDGYNCHYINSHGHTIDTQNYYEFIISRKRSRKMKLSEPADVVFMKHLVKHINSRGDVKVNYDGTSKYTYRGTNLQEGDGHGVCFIYPLIVWYYFGQYYTKSQKLSTKFGEIEVAPGKTLMKNGDFNHFIESLFWRFSPNYFELLAHQSKVNAPKQKFSVVFQNFIEKDSFRFIKMLIGPYISYILQSGFKHKIKC